MAPLIIVPGILEDETGWAAALDPLEPQLIANHGETIEAMATALLQRAPPRSVLLGHSLGGYVALAAALAAPERFAGLILVSTSPLPDTAENSANRERLIAAAQEDFPAVARRLARAVLAPPNLAACLAATEAVLLRGTPERFTREQRAAARRPDQTRHLANLSMPTLVVTGSEDAIVAPSASQTMAAGVASARLVTLEGCGHVPQIERPAELGEAIRNWIDQV